MEKNFLLLVLFIIDFSCGLVFLRNQSFFFFLTKQIFFFSNKIFSPPKPIFFFLFSSSFFFFFCLTRSLFFFFFFLFFVSLLIDKKLSKARELLVRSAYSWGRSQTSQRSTIGIYLFLD